MLVIYKTLDITKPLETNVNQSVQNKAHPLKNNIYLVMGVMASGKTSIALEYSAAINGVLIEADDLHSDHSKSLMAKGIALTDDERWPWFARIVDRVLCIQTEQPIIIACSALRLAYRDYLREHLGELTVIYLEATPELISQRAANRSGHFMSPTLINSQFKTLEAPEKGKEANVIRVSIDDTKAHIVQNILNQLNH